MAKCIQKELKSKLHENVLFILHISALEIECRRGDGNLKLHRSPELSHSYLPEKSGPSQGYNLWLKGIRSRPSVQKFFFYVSHS